MDQSVGNYTLIIAGIAAIIAELFIGVATGFDLMVIGVILILSASIGLIVNSFVVSLIVAILLSVLYVVFGRKFVKQKISIATTATNTDALIGKKGIVVKKITHEHAGQVKVDGEIWRAVAKSTLDEETMVTVQSVSGVTLSVSK